MPTSVALCTLCGEETPTPATHSYTWDWGEAGFCCSKHLVTLQHRMQALVRTCTFVALTPGQAPAMTQDERREYHAKVLAAQDEVTAVKARNLLLFNSNTALTAELKRVRAELVQYQQQLADTRAELDQIIGEKQQALRQLAETNHELARLQGVLNATEATEAAGIELGVVDPTSVS